MPKNIQEEKNLISRKFSTKKQGKFFFHSYFSHQDERYKLLIILPMERRGLRQLTYDLSAVTLRGVMDALRPSRVKATVPTFMVEGFVILTPALQRVNLQKPKRKNYL